MKRITEKDLHAISAKLSNVGFGVFPTRSLVNFGATVILKPGAVTAENVVLSGHDVAEILAGEYVVFPLAVEYAQQPVSENMGAIASDLHALDGELDRLEDGFGAVYGDVAARLRRRYERIAKRYRRVMSRLITKGKDEGNRRTERLYGRLEKVWEKMKAKGMSVVGLTAPSIIRQKISRSVSEADEKMTKSSDTMDATKAKTKVPSAYDFPKSDSPFADDIPATDEDLLEDDDELSSDLRAESVGYIFSGAEHDYFGLEGTPAEIVLSDDEDLSVDDGSGIEELEEGAETADQELEAADQELLEEGEEFELDDELESIEEGGRDAAPSKAAPLTKAQAKKAAQTRANLSKEMQKVQQKLDEGKGEEAHSYLASALRHQADMLDYVDKRLKGGSANGGVMYRRLRPARRGRNDRPPRAVVIGIRKRADCGPMPHIQRHVAPYAVTFSGSPVDVMAAGMASVSQGYTALDGVTAIRENTIPLDFVQGSADLTGHGPGSWSDDETP